MAYLTPTELETIIGLDTLNVIGDHDGDGVYETATVTEALDTASGTVDTYLSAYLPLTSPIVSEVTDAIAAIANERLRQARDMSTKDSRQWYEDVTKWLQDVASGLATLPGGGATDDDGLAPGAPVMSAEDRVWTRSSGGTLF